MARIEDIIASVECRQLVVDPFLKNAEFCRNRRGGLLRYTGGFTVVFPCIVNGEKWAFRCWHANVGDMQHRLKIVSESLERSSLSYFSEFRYVDNGIIIGGKACPTTRMKWIEGNDLKTYILEHRDDRACLIRLATDFFSMTNELHKRSIAHGDLQHGNIIVDSRGGLHLIDYDSMYVSELESIAAADIIAGKPDYQHPSRSSNRFASKKLDYFSEAVILCGILAIAYKPSLADKFNVKDADSLLFTRNDFDKFLQSDIYKDLDDMPDSVVLLRRIITYYLTKDDINLLEPIDKTLEILNVTTEASNFASIIHDADISYMAEIAAKKKKAEEQREERLWQNYCQQGTTHAYTLYLNNYPNGHHADEAKNRIDELKREEAAKEKAAWENCCFVNMSSAYSKYIKEYPSGTYISVAKEKYKECKDREDWSRASTTNTLESYQKYLKYHPKGTFANNAKAIIPRLEAEEIKRRKKEEEMRLWRIAKLKNTFSSFVSYAIQYPKGEFISEANNRIISNIFILSFILDIPAIMVYALIGAIGFSIGIEMSDSVTGTMVRVFSVPFFCLLAIATYVVFIRIKTTIELSDENKVGKGSRIKNFFWFISVLSAFVLYFIFIPPLISSDKGTYNNTYIQQPQKLEMNDYARSLENDINKQLKSLEAAKQYNSGLDYNMKQKVSDKLKELSKYNSNKYKGYKERYDKL